MAGSRSTGPVSQRARGPEADLTIGPPGTPAVQTEAAAPDAVLDGTTDLLTGEEVEVRQVTEAEVRALLKGLGGAAGYVLRHPDVPDLWRFTDRELGDLTPPLTRICNRPERARLRAAVIRGDEISVALTLAGYAGRNTDDLRRARKAAHDDEQRETGGAEGPGGPADRGLVGDWQPRGGHGGGVPQTNDRAAG